MGPYLLSRRHNPNTRDWREHGIDGVRGVIQRSRRIGVSAWWALAPALLALANPHLRQWLGHAVGTVCVIGGFVAAPLLTLVAWLGLIMPERMVLHQASTTLFAVSLIWVVLAVLSAHMQAHRQQDDPH